MEEEEEEAKGEEEEELNQQKRTAVTARMGKVRALVGWTRKTVVE